MSVGRVKIMNFALVCLLWQEKCIACILCRFCSPFLRFCACDFIKNANKFFLYNVIKYFCKLFEELF